MNGIYSLTQRNDQPSLVNTSRPWVDELEKGRNPFQLNCEHCIIII